MEFLILGPIDVRNASGAVALGGIKPRAVLAVLLLHANEPVSAERLALALWGEDAPGGAVKTVQVHVSRLRKALGDADVVSTTPAGYCLRVLPGELDAERFEGLVEDARRALTDGRPEDASATLREALGLWRGPALAELAHEPFASAEIARLEEQRLSALELRVDADLTAGRHAELVGELQRLVSEHPTRERLAGQLMLALYRCGRQSEALEAYAAARRVLVDEMGLEPGPQLRDLHAAILRQDDALDAQPAEAGLPPQLDAAAAQPLAGRDDELAWLLARWDRACEGEGAVVTVAGPRGAGKRRLLAEAASTIHRRGGAILFASGNGPADALVAAVRRASTAPKPTLLVVDAADRAGRDALAELAELGPAIAQSPVLAVACAEDALALAHLRAADALELGPLGEDAVRAIAARYAPATALAELPAEWLLKASEGMPSRVHELASQWARREAARHVDAIAGRAEAGRAELRSVEAELTGGVVALQESRDREPPRAGGGDEGPPVVCPFKGLASYDVGDARHFFGRERLVAELVARLVGAPLLGVVGPSGSGKSSLLRAGLLPALSAGVLPGSEAWPQVLFRPGAHPLSELAVGLAKAQGDGRIVLAVDQFEETFTVCEDEDERAEFVSELVKAAEDPDGRWVVVIALRADYYGRCAAYPELAAMLGAGNVLVRPMQPDELRRAIERPAQRVGLRIEPELVDALVADVEKQPGGLPLMSTALLELWQRRDGRRLRHSAYAQTGGVQGAVARLAESAFAQLDEGQQQVARGVLMRLVGSTEDDAVERRRVPLAELEIERDEDVARVVALLTDRRLLTVSAGSVELAHEALLREWPRLRGWIEDDREGLRVQRAVSGAAAEWDRLDRDEGALYRGARLAEAVEWRDSRKPVLNKLEREFLAAGEASREHERVTRRRRMVAAFTGLATVLVAVAIVAIIAVVQGRETERQRDLSASRDLAARSASLVGADPRLSLAVGLEALKRTDTPQAESAVRQAALADRAVAITPAHKGIATGVAVSPDGRRLATSGEDGLIRVWSTAGVRPLATIEGHKAPALAVAFNADGTRIASVGVDAQVAIADADGRNREVLASLPGGAFARSVEFSRDGEQLLVATVSGAVGLVPTGGPRPAKMRVLGSHAQRATARFDASGTRVVSASDDGEARIWRLSDDSSTTLAHGTKLRGAAFSPDGRLVATAAEDGIVRIWDAADGDFVRAVVVDRNKLVSVRFAGDSRGIVTGGEDGVVRLSSVQGGPPLSELQGHAGAVYDALRVPRSNLIASVGEDGTLRTWAPRAVRQHVATAGHSPNQPSFSPDDKHVVSGYDDGDVHVWDPATGADIELPGHRDTSEARYSTDGSHVVSWSRDGSVRLSEPGRGPSRTVVAPGEGGEVLAAAVDRSGSRVAIAFLDVPATIRSLDGGKPVALPDEVAGVITALEFSPDGKHLAAATEGGTAYVFRVTDGKQERKHDVGSKVLDVAFGPDSRQIAAAAGDGSVRVWPARGVTAAVLYGHERGVNTVAFSPDGKLVVTAGQDGTVRVWSAAGGPALVTLEAYDGNAPGAAFSHRGLRVVSVDARERVLRITPCEVCGPFEQALRRAHDRPVRTLSAVERQRLLSSGD